jgi:fermentation-respiration switch protein FrsA (DUF1100 family)
VRRLTRPLETAERGTALLTDDGVRLSAHHDAPRPGAASPDLAVVVAHGFTLSWANPAARTLAAELTERAGVVAFDFRGHGRSGGVSTVGDLEVHDVDAALRYARWLGYSRVVTLGFSMGAAVVVRQAGLAGLGRTSPRPDAVAAVSGPSRWNFRGTTLMRRVHAGIGTRAGRAVVRHVYGTRVARLGWEPWPDPPDALAAAVSPTPLLVVHGDADPYFPPDHAQWLYDAAREPKELWLEPGFGHAEVATAPELVGRIARWLDDASASARMRR